MALPLYSPYMEHSWGLCYGAMAPTTLMSVHERSWVWCHGAMTAHNALVQYLSMLMSTHKCSRVLLSDPEYFWVILSVQVVDSVINKKCWFLKWLPFSILAISRSRFHQLITNWIVWKSTWKGLLKMSKIEFLDNLEAEKLTKQKWEQYCGTPWVNPLYILKLLKLHEIKYF